MAEENFLIVSIGSSAGGVEPCVRLVREVPADAGLAIVIVNHLRRGPTMLPEILARATSMRTQLITAGMSVERNHVYVAPPNCDLTLHNGAFHLDALSKPFGWPNRITIFLNSLVENWKGPRAAVILSGVDSDGAHALRAIKKAGGVTFAQRAETAVHPDMPQSALDTGCVDFELSPEEIAHELTRIRF
jgi:two-component system chemotaxis response regulator CheB